VTERVVLVGLPGSGKSTVGAALAEALDRPFVDVDAEIEVLTGATPAQWLRTEGEAAFRAVEERAMESALADGPGAVVATGGGSVESSRGRELLGREPFVVYLRCTPAVLLERLDGGDRPLVAEPSEARLAALAARREPLYEEVAAVSVDGDGDVAGVVASIVAMVRR
jgi:shikimate kinase